MLPSGDCEPPPGLPSPGNPVGPVDALINCFSFFTVWDRFVSGPVDFSWAAIFSRVPSLRAVWSWRNWSRAVLHTGVLSQYGLPSSAITTGSTHSRLLA